MSNCRVCEKACVPVFNFGKMPIANAFQDSPNTTLFKFTLETVFCEECYLFQLNDVPKPSQMFHGNYPFFTSSSENMKRHFKDYSMTLTALHDSPMRILEIGSNDGTFLGFLKEAGHRVVGVEPSSNVASISLAKGIDTVVDFFNENTTNKLIDKFGIFDVIVGSNVICHIENINEVFSNVYKLLNNEGLFVFEEPYLIDMLDKSSFDQIYDEHIYLFCALSIQALAERHSLKLVSAEHLDTHGGSMRYWITKNANRSVEVSLESLIKTEENYFRGGDWINNFSRSVESKKEELHKLLRELIDGGNSICGYAATSKSTTILNFCDLGDSMLNYVMDTTPLKIGKYTPGTNILIVNREEALKNPPDYFVVFAWNHLAEIVEKENTLGQFSANWIVLHPHVQVIPNANA